MRTSLGLDDRWQKYPVFGDLMSEGTNTAKLRMAADMLGKVVACELTERQRQCLSMYYYGGLTMPEIASELGINKSSVSRAIGRAKTRIERSMKYAMQMNIETF